MVVNLRKTPDPPVRILRRDARFFLHIALARESLKEPPPAVGEPASPCIALPADTFGIRSRIANASGHPPNFSFV